MKTKSIPTSQPKYTYFVWLILLMASFHAYPQTITRDDTPTISGTVCPLTNTFYTVSVPSAYAGCNITWTPTNGDVVSNNGLPKVTINWKDTPGATATLKCTFSGCSGGTADAAVSFADQLILSVKNQSFGSYNNAINIDYCTTRSVTVMVPHMYVPGTGGIV